MGGARVSLVAELCEQPVIVHTEDSATTPQEITTTTTMEMVATTETAAEPIEPVANSDSAPEPEPSANLSEAREITPLVASEEVASNDEATQVEELKEESTIAQASTVEDATTSIPCEDGDKALPIVEVVNDSIARK